MAGSLYDGSALEKEKPSSAYQIAWLIVSTKSGTALIWASISPSPLCAVALYAVMRESGGMEWQDVNLERQSLIISSNGHQPQQVYRMGGRVVHLRKGTGLERRIEWAQSRKFSDCIFLAQDRL